MMSMLMIETHQNAPWAVRHNLEVQRNLNPVVLAFNALQAMAESHEARFETPIGDDYILGDHWKDMAIGLRGMLNGDCGDLDCGTMDEAILKLAESHGMDLEA